ncbi:MAG: histidine phosphatase family protein [Myxococcales bacterium]|nr:histidine phosphatase family protein [Myxococcales bacterium]
MVKSGMALILLRHATAVDERRDLSDDARYLTAGGRTTALAVGEALRTRLQGRVHIVSSPLVRAVQTAELALAPLGMLITTSEALRPDNSPRAAFAELTAHLAAADYVIAVGHEPSMSALAALAMGSSHHRALGRGEALAFDAGALLWNLTARDATP